MKYVLIALFVMVSGITAKAAELSLNDIDTNSCAKAQSEINLLNFAKQGIYVSAQCSGYGSYQSNGGQYYDYRLYTSVAVPGWTYAGEQIELNYINTNDCSYAVSEVRLLSNSQYTVRPVCVGPGSFASDNGRVYSYRVVTTLTVNY